MQTTKVCDPALSQKLATRSSACAHLLDVLSKTTVATPGGHHERDLKQTLQTDSNTLDGASIAKCQAIAFLEMTKGGIAVTYGKGTGFLIQRLEDAKGGQQTWSAPVLFKVSQWGVGTGIGVEDVNFVVVINNAAAVHKMVHEPKPTFGADLFVPLTSTLNPTSYESTKVYALSDGAMILDIGITGTEIEIDKEAMARAYGPGKSVDDVLCAPPLEQLSVLYSKLVTLSQQGVIRAQEEAERLARIAASGTRY